VKPSIPKPDKAHPERERGGKPTRGEPKATSERDAPRFFGVTTESTRYQVFETGLRVGHSGGRQCVRNQGIRWTRHRADCKSGAIEMNLTCGMKWSEVK
jgi:transposase